MKVAIKESLLDRAIEYISPESALKRRQAKIRIMLNKSLSKRHYDGASWGPRLDGWYAPKTSANYESKIANATLRDRARDLIRNDAFANHALTAMTTGVVGSGIVPQIHCPDETKLKKINRLWKEWAETPAIDFEGRNDFYGLQNLAARTMFGDGEGLARISRTGDHPLKTQLTLLECDFIDSFKEMQLADGGYIIQGVEVDSNMRVCAYWLYNQHPGGLVNISGYTAMSQRVEKKNLLHYFKQDRPGQLRGISAFAPVMTMLKHMSDYTASEAYRRLIASCYAIFITDLEPPDDPGLKPNDPDAIDKLTPGMIRYLHPGQDVKFSNPPQVTGFEEFWTCVLRTIACGLGCLTYESLTSDYSKCNFSSSRMAWINTHREIEAIRWHVLIPQFCDPVFKLFLEGLERLGIDTRDVTATWTPPKRELISPKEEMEAMTQGIRAGILSLSEVLRQMGIDPDLHLQEIKKDIEKLDSLGLKLESDARYDQPTKSQESEAA